MTTEKADARPEKGLFLEMFIRDLTLEDCVLDLVDNSIDSLIRHRDLDVSEALLPVSADGGGAGRSMDDAEPATIDIRYDSKHFRISDTCGGISVADARQEVFRFGHSADTPPGQLGVYGIGLKRAIFKVGNHITIESKTADEGFNMVIDVPKWASNRFDWTLPFQPSLGGAEPGSAGTTIEIRSFRQEVAERFKSGTFEKSLYDMIARTYSLFLNRYVTVTLNGHRVEPMPIPIGESDHATSAKEVFQQDSVTVTLYAGLAPRDSDGQWHASDAGWYAACNGRFVVIADKTELTGWGLGQGPSFVPKYSGFVGIAFFYSRNPLALPWTTTKRGLNRESLVFQKARGRMSAISRPILTFLNNMYAATEVEREPHRRIAEEINPVDVRSLSGAPARSFSTTARPPAEPTVRVQYDAKEAELERVRKHLRKSRWPATRIGRFTFDHYLKTECPE